MPLHSIQRLSPTAVLGLWHLTEPPAELWQLLPQPQVYRALMPTTADATRQAQWLAGRALTHMLAAEILAASPLADLLVRNDGTGRPWLAGTGHGLAMSLSHSGAWVAAVVTQGGRAGVDVEIIRDKAQRLAGKFLAPAEWAAAQRAAPESSGSEGASAHYTLLWSAKETLYKLAAQRGIIFRQQLLLDAFEPQQSGEIPATLVSGTGETRHRICYYQPAPGYVLTYCHEPAA